MRFIHAADIHLDSPLIGLASYEGAPVDQIRAATRKALSALVDLSIEERVAFVLIAGDVYDRDWRDYNTGLFFAREMGRLRQAGIRVYLIHGNHDAESTISRKLTLPENVFVFSAKEPETKVFVVNDLKVAIHGQSFGTRDESRDLSKGYPPPVAGHFNIGLLHTDIEGRPGHDNYAPATLEGLSNRGYDYWALGHVHGITVLRQDPYIVYSGNIQGRSIKETGPKGVMLVDVDEEFSVKVERRYLDVVRWEECHVDATGAESGHAVVRWVTESLTSLLDGIKTDLLAVRVVITGRCMAHQELGSDLQRWRNEIRSAATDLSAERIWVEKIKVATQPETEQAVSSDMDWLTEALMQMGDSSANLEDADLESIFADLHRSLVQVPELYPGDISLGLNSNEARSELLDEVRNLILSAVMSKGSEG